MFHGIKVLKMRENKLFTKFLWLIIFVLTTILIHISVNFLEENSINFLGIILAAIFGIVLWLFYIFIKKI